MSVGVGTQMLARLLVGGALCECMAGLHADAEQGLDIAAEFYEQWQEEEQDDDDHRGSSAGSGVGQEGVGSALQLVQEADARGLGILLSSVRCLNAFLSGGGTAAAAQSDGQKHAQALALQAARQLLNLHRELVSAGYSTGAAGRQRVACRPRDWACRRPPSPNREAFPFGRGAY
eukprot:COSAG01_NODE_14475_length_1449_cov_1.854815_1_plen_175_part_00